MPVNWDTFERLPGAADVNFEKLCRALIHLHYGRFGRFAALAQQPGIEFHLNLQEACALGEPGRWYGWQCRWYGISSGRAIGTTRRNKIVDAIAKTQRELPHLSDWVLWTRFPLTRADQAWFNGLATHMRLHLWTADNADALLSGPADILRGTYFGELVMDPDTMAGMRARAIAPIRIRWQPDVHQSGDVESRLRQALSEAQAWDDLRVLADQLGADAAAAAVDMGDLEGSLADAITEVIGAVEAMATALRDTHAALDRGDLDLVHQQLNTRPIKPRADLVALPRRLRAMRKRVALIATNALADIGSGNVLLDSVESLLRMRLIAIVAEAGYGKTELAAQLTDAVGNRPAGLLLHGRDLHAGHSLDDLARSVVIHGTQVPTMEALVAAVNAAGERARRRLPIVIDGLNEAEDPRDWKPTLSILDEMLSHYPYVLVVVTVRGAFIDETLPPDVLQCELNGFDHDVVPAVRRYFAYYRIEASDADLPWEMLNHPLMLRLFCEVTNPTRERVVGIERMPGSLTTLFDRYLELAADRVAALAPRTQRYYVQEVQAALYEIGVALWDEKARSLDLRTLRQRLDDGRRPWNESLLRALEQEGILLRVRGDTATDAHVAVVYDALAGHIVASALATKYGRSHLGDLLKDPGARAALGESLPDRHPLASDMLKALVALVPLLLHQQLWPLLEEPLRTLALYDTVNLEGNLLDANTVEELTSLVMRTSPLPHNVLQRLWQTRGAAKHPLNADFLDGMLRSMSVSDRDLRWTEWIRVHTKEVLEDLRRWEHRWRSAPERSVADALRARWMMWTLTSTVRLLRDQATRTLYWFGRGTPKALFALCTSALTINDPYVSERMLAASYGVTMARQYDIEDRTFVDNILPQWARTLYAAMFAAGAPHATTHLLARNYARRMVEIAARLHPALFSDEQLERIRPPYHEGGIRAWRQSENKNKGEYRDGNSPFDFLDDNPMAQLGPTISKYHTQTDEYKEVEGQLWWRIYDLGYSLDAFGTIDSRIANERHMRGVGGDSQSIIGYGRKYCWIATCELAGYRDDVGLLRDEWHPAQENWTHVDIDPSFPEELREHDMVHGDLLGDRQRPIAEWITQDPVFTFEQMEQVEEIDGEPGPWVLLKAYISQYDEQSGRRMFCSLIGALVEDAVAEELEMAVKSAEHLDIDRISTPETHYTYAGEIPWCETYPASESSEVTIVTGYETVTQPAGIARHEWWYRSIGNETTEEAMAVSDDTQTETQTQVPIRKTCNMTIATISHGWESYHSELNPNTGADVPARQFADLLALGSRPQTFDLFDSEGHRASMSFDYGDSHVNSQDFTYVRKDILDLFLGETAQRLVWMISGERSFASVGRGGRQNSIETPAYARYGEVQFYS